MLIEAASLVDLIEELSLSVKYLSTTHIALCGMQNSPFLLTPTTFFFLQFLSAVVTLTLINGCRRAPTAASVDGLKLQPSTFMIPPKKKKPIETCAAETGWLCKSGVIISD